MFLISFKCSGILLLFSVIILSGLSSELVDHQLCQKFAWVDNSSVAKLPPDSPFLNCVNIKLDTVPGSNHLYAIVSLFNRRYCATYNLKAIVLTLVTQSSSNSSSVPVGTWSKVPFGTKQSLLPQQFPIAYLNNNHHLSIVTCSRSDEDEENLLLVNQSPQPNCLFHWGELLPGEGIVGQAHVFMDADEPQPVQLTAELLVDVNTQSFYWTYDGSSNEIVYDPLTVTIKHSTEPTKKRFLLKSVIPNYKTGSKRVIRQSNPPTAMCHCAEPMRAGSPPGPGTVLDTIPRSIASCFEFKMSNCPDSHTGELLGAVFALKSVNQGCPRGTKIVDMAIIAINQNGYPYGRLDVNRNVKMCFATGNPYPDAKKVKPVLHQIYPLQYECTLYPSINPNTLYPLPKWLTINADVETEDSPFPGYLATVFQFVLGDKVKTSSAPQPEPTSLQFIIEFGVIEPGQSYQIYRMRTEQRSMAFTAANQVNFQGSTTIASDITLNPNYQQFPVNCQPPTANPPGQAPAKDFICQCVGQCTSASACGPPDPNVGNCFKVVLNVKPTPVPAIGYMSFRINSGTGCPINNIVIHDVMFAMLSRHVVGTSDSKVDGQWSVLSMAEFSQYTTVGSCLDATAANLEPQLGSRFTLHNCTGSSTGTVLKNGMFWNYRPLTKPVEIVCGKLTIPKAASNSPVDLQMGYKVVYSSGGGGPKKEFRKMHKNIYRDDGTNLVLIYDQDNDRVALHTQVDFKRTCVATPLIRPSQMCACYNPQRPSGVTFPSIVELSGSPLAGCFEMKMADCKNSHTSEHLGILFLQKNCPAKPDLRTIDMSLIALNELGYPYGELEATLTSAECLDISSSPKVVDYRPIVNQLHPISYSCTGIHNSANSKYGSKAPGWLTLNLDVLNDFSIANSPPYAVQVMLKEQVQTSGSPYPVSLQFIAEFTVKESANSPVTAYRIASDHRKLGFTATHVNFGSSPVESSVPRIHIHPDYTDMDATAKLCDNKLANQAGPKPYDLSFSTCACFAWEQGSKTSPATPAEAKQLLDCLTLNFAQGTGTPATFFVSVAKFSSSGSAACANLVISQFILGMMGRDEKGAVKALSTEGSWDIANIANDYVVGKCYATGTTPSRLKPQKAGAFPARGCSDDVQIKANHFYYRGLLNDGDVHCGKWTMVNPPTFTYQEIQVHLKLQFVLSGKFLAYNGRLNVAYQIRQGPPLAVNPVSKAEFLNTRLDMLHLTNPVKRPNVPCFDTPFVPFSDICDCTRTRHGGMVHDPTKTGVQDLDLYSGGGTPVPADCFEFKVTKCTVKGEKFDTIGAVLIIRAPTSTPACRADIDVEDASFVALNQNGYPFGEPSYHDFHRVCFQPADLLKYELRNKDFTRPVGGKCDSRKRPNGSAFGAEFEYGGIIPSWLQVGIGAEVPNLKLPVAVQIYLKFPPVGTRPSATRIMFISEMAIKDRSSGTKTLIRVKTKVFNLNYIAATGHFDPAAATLNPTAKIDRNEQWYETDSSNEVCHQTGPGSVTKRPLPVQTCACFEYSDGRIPLGTRLDPSSQLYHDNVEKCIFYEWTVHPDTTPKQTLHFYLTVWTKTQQQERACGDFQVVAMPLTPLMRSMTSSGQTGAPHPFRQWIRVTTAAPGVTVSNPDENLQRGQHCKMNPGYSGKLRRLPPENHYFVESCNKLSSSSQNQFYFFYPLMNQPDGANAYCAALQLSDLGLPADANKNPERFEFQIIGYLFLDFLVPPMKYYAMKRSPVFEFFRDAPATAPPTTPISIQFTGKVFEVQKPSHYADRCYVDICMFN